MVIKFTRSLDIPSINKISIWSETQTLAYCRFMEPLSPLIFNQSFDILFTETERRILRIPILTRNRISTNRTRAYRNLDRNLHQSHPFIYRRRFSPIRYRTCSAVVTILSLSSAQAYLYLRVQTPINPSAPRLPTDKMTSTRVRCLDSQSRPPPSSIIDPHLFPSHTLRKDSP